MLFRHVVPVGQPPVEFDGGRILYLSELFSEILPLNRKQ